MYQVRLKSLKWRDFPTLQLGTRYGSTTTTLGVLCAFVDFYEGILSHTNWIPCKEIFSSSQRSRYAVNLASRQCRSILLATSALSGWTTDSLSITEMESSRNTSPVTQCAPDLPQIYSPQDHLWRWWNSWVDGLLTPSWSISEMNMSERQNGHMRCKEFFS